MAYRLAGDKPLSMLGYCCLDPDEQISLESHTFSFKKMHLKMSSGEWRRPFCLGLNMLNIKIPGICDHISVFFLSFIAI